MCIPLRGNSVCILFISSKKAWNFLTKFWYSDQMFSRNIFTYLCLKSETSGHAQLMSILLYMLLANILHGCSWKLTLRVPLDKWGHKMTPSMWSSDFSWKQSIKQAIKLTLNAKKNWQKDSAKFTDENMFLEKVTWSIW